MPTLKQGDWTGQVEKGICPSCRVSFEKKEGRWQCPRCGWTFPVCKKKE